MELAKPNSYQDKVHLNHRGILKAEIPNFNEYIRMKIFRKQFVDKFIQQMSKMDVSSFELGREQGTLNFN